MSKNRPITGKLRIKNGRYYAVYSCAGAEGKTKDVWRSLNLEEKPGNKRKALEKMEEMKCQFQGIIDVPGYDILFVDYIRQWKEKKEGEVEESTFASIRLIVDRKICGYFEPLKLKLSEVKPRHIRQFYEHLYKNGRADGKGGLSISSIKSIKGILNEAFNAAIVCELILSNPTASVKLPALYNPRKPYVVLNQEQANRLLGYAADDDLMYPLLLITLRYGLRHGEVLGLKWGAIDFERGLLRIETTITGGKHPEKNKPKTETSKGTFPLFPEVIDALLIRKRAQEKQRELFKEFYVESDYVFTRESGGFLRHKQVMTEFKKILAGCGLAPMRFHELRHSTACIMHSMGMELKELQAWMRHGKISMTADVYLHISKERECELANSLQNMLSAEPLPKESISWKRRNLA